MRRRNHVSYPEKIAELLEEGGTYRSTDFADELGIGSEHARAALSLLRAKNPPNKKGLRSPFIVSWEKSEVKGRFYLRAVYAKGPGKDVESPGPMSRAEYTQRYREGAKQRISSVFDLGRTVDEARPAVDWRTIKTSTT